MVVLDNNFELLPGYTLQDLQKPVQQPVESAAVSKRYIAHQGIPDVNPMRLFSQVMNERPLWYPKYQA